jgi:hypothetical protein
LAAYFLAGRGFFGLSIRFSSFSALGRFSVISTGLYFLVFAQGQWVSRWEAFSRPIARPAPA